MSRIQQAKSPKPRAARPSRARPAAGGGRAFPMSRLASQLALITQQMAAMRSAVEAAHEGELVARSAHNG